MNRERYDMQKMRENQAMKMTINVGLLSALLCAALSGCGGLMPAGAGFGAGHSGVSGSSKGPASQEHLVYRIDDHRYITINGNDGCEGGVVYYDRQLGIRTPVAYTGFSLGDGVAESGYAIDSTYIAIPVLGWSDSMGGSMAVYYSYDQGRTFHKLRYASAGVPSEGAKISVKGDYLYVYYGESESSLKFDISHKVPTDEFGQVTNWTDYLVNPGAVPQNIRSPSGIERMSCGAPITRSSPAQK